LLLGLGLVALPFISLPLPRWCDPRLEELPATSYGELQRYAGTRTRSEIEAALALIDPDGALAPYIHLGDDALEVRAERLGPGLRLPLRATPAATSRPLRKVGLDPGHWGGQWSHNEQRYIERNELPVREGDLSWATALLVQRGLAGEGVDTVLLRGPPPGYPFDADSDPGYDPARELRLWLAENRPGGPWLSAWSALALLREGRGFAETHPFELYNHYDLRRRAGRATEENVDLTLSLHYNFTARQQNGVLVFVPGTFLADELVTASQRFWALRRVLDGSLDEERRLAGLMATALMRALALPALTEVGNDAWRPVDPDRGVYARNLAVLRRAPGPALLLEGPCLNERDEYRRMQDRSIIVGGQRHPARVQQYADAVVSALKSAR
jgi:N-acetylmuramoyl-L-alanine amidase